MALQPSFLPQYDAQGDALFDASYAEDSVALVVSDLTQNDTLTSGVVVAHAATDALFVSSYDAQGNATFAPRYSSSGATNNIVVLHNVENGNIDPASVVITGEDTATPTIIFDALKSIYPLWRHFNFAITGAEGKTPTFIINRASKDGSTYISPEYKPVHTTDYQTWNQASVTNLVGGASGTVEFSFANPLPSGTSYIASSPYFRVTDSTAFASLLLSTHSAIASPTASADAGGVYATTAAVNNAFGTPAGANPQYAIKLDWGGATTDGNAKRKLVVISGIHGAGSAHSDIVFRESILWMLNDTSQAAQDFRSNFEVYCYFLINPNGHKAGEAKFTVASNQNPNRSWNVSGASALQIITDLQNAIVTDTGGNADAFLSWQGDVYTTTDFNMWLTATEHNPNTRSAAMQEIIDQAMINFGAAPHVNSSAATTTDVFWANAVLNCKAAIGIDIAAAGLTTVTHYQDLTNKWMDALVAADAAGAFSSSSLILSGLQQQDTFESIVVSAANSTALVLDGLTQQDIFSSIEISVSPSVPTLVVADLVQHDTFSSAIIPVPVPERFSGFGLIYNDAIAQSTLTAGSQATGFDVNNVKKDRKSKIWRSVDLSQQTITATWVDAQIINAVALIFTNLIKGSTYQIRLYSQIVDITPVFDSGLITVGFSYDAPVGFASIGYQSFAYGGGNYSSAFFEEQTCQKLELFINSPGNPDDAVEISRIVAGQSLKLKRGPSYGAEVSYADTTESVKTYGGDSIRNAGHVSKSIRFDLKHMPLLDKSQIINMTKGVGGRLPVFVSLVSSASDPEDRQHFEIYGYIDEDVSMARLNYQHDSASLVINEF